MQKRIIVFALLCFSLLLTACEEVNTEKDTGSDGIETDKAKKLVTDFVEEVYTVEEPLPQDAEPEEMLDIGESVRDDLTEEEWEELHTKRFFLIPYEAADHENASLSVKDIQVETDEETEEEVSLTHQFTVVLTNKESDEIREEELSGQITISNTKDGLKISRYYDKALPVELYSP